MGVGGGGLGARSSGAGQFLERIHDSKRGVIVGAWGLGRQGDFAGGSTFSAVAMVKTPMPRFCVTGVPPVALAERTPKAEAATLRLERRCCRVRVS